VPHWLEGDSTAAVPRRPLTVVGAANIAVLAALIAGLGGTATLVRATSACFIAIYVLSILSAARILDGRSRAVALGALVFVALLAVFSAWYLLVPACAALIVLATRRAL
jgi:amino acid efflux transporter